MKTKPHTIPVPRSPQRQIFADHVLRGISLLDAYRASGFPEIDGDALEAAARLREEPDVSDYITAVQLQAADDSVMNLLERRRFFARVIRTPITSIDLEDPKKKNHDLLARTIMGAGADGTMIMEIQKVCPLMACELDARAAGEQPDPFMPLASALGTFRDFVNQFPALSSGETKARVDGGPS